MEQNQPIAHHIVVYTKPGCHLCEDALELLNRLRNQFQLTIEEVNIEKNDALFNKYFDRIPVLVIDFRTTLFAPIRIDDVRAALVS